MTTAEKIYRAVKDLPEPMLHEVLVQFHHVSCPVHFHYLKSDEPGFFD